VATSARGFADMRSVRGRINANATRKIPYAARTPNAIDPTAAHINITKFNKSVI
jgi:hypothetical protein